MSGWEWAIVLPAAMLAAIVVGLAVTLALIAASRAAVGWLRRRGRHVARR